MFRIFNDLCSISAALSGQPFLEVIVNWGFGVLGFSGFRVSELPIWLLMGRKMKIFRVELIAQSMDS